jgi:hypothetical protein
MSHGFSIPETKCEVPPKCDNKATEQITLMSSRVGASFNTNRQKEIITLCKEHKNLYDKGKMYPFFNRLKNVEKERNINNRLFHRK